MLTQSKTLSGLMGLCVGDALGVPVEFTSRTERVKSPVTSMQGYGTWSDDSSLTFCLAECLCREFSLSDIANLFCRWYNEAYWTPHGEVFDIGNTTYAAIMRLQQGISPLEAGGTSQRDPALRVTPLRLAIAPLSTRALMSGGGGTVSPCNLGGAVR